MSNPYDKLVPEDADSVNPTPKQTTPEPLETDMRGKGLLRSKTFWINAITAIAGIVTVIGGSDIVQENPEYAGYAATIIGMVNVIMRLFTKEPVTGLK